MLGFGRKRKRDLQEFRRRLESGEPTDEVVADYLAKGRASDIRFGIGCVIAGLAIAVASLVGGLHERALTNAIPGGSSTTGRVSMVVAVGCKGGCEWQETIEFRVPGQGTFNFEPPNTTSKPEIGQVVSVSYLPSNPAMAHDLNDTSNDGDTLIVIVAPLAAVVGILTGGLMFLAAGKRSTRTAGKHSVELR
jgi:hypothetical protein